VEQPTVRQVRRAYEAYYQLQVVPTQVASEWFEWLIKSVGTDEAYRLANAQSNEEDAPEPPVCSIYARFGGKVSIVLDAGEHQPSYLRHPGRLVQLLYLEDHERGWAFAHTLRADGGIATIDRAIGLAPKVKLMTSELTKALKEAE
jgi:hypothetical protein